jgi:hypothetical protein
VKLRLLAIILIAFTRYHPLLRAEGLQTDFFPNQILFPKFLADGTSQQMSVNKDFHSRRVAYTYRTGIADQGQFYRQRIDLSLMGVYLDF